MSGSGIQTAPTGRQGNPFNPRTVLALVATCFIAFLLLLYFMAIGDTGEPKQRGVAHATSGGLNGYAGLVDLLERNGQNVEVSRSEDGLLTYGLLVVTPRSDSDAKVIGDILEDRKYYGPTLVILPKWWAYPLSTFLPDKVKSETEEDWVELGGAGAPEWIAELDEPYALEVSVKDDLRIAVEELEPSEGQDENKDTGKEPYNGAVAPKKPAKPANFSGFNLSGQLPDARFQFAKPEPTDRILVSGGASKALALTVDAENTDDAYPVTYVIEPDLVNNYGLSDETRARLAMALVERAGAEGEDTIVFDMTAFGIARSDNLLTLAFRPPFLAATLCLIAMLIVIGWRAFKRFGPPIAEGPAIAFGKERLVANGAGLIVRARRFSLLADPYIELIAQRLRKALGLSTRDREKLDDAIEQRLTGEPNFTARAEALRNASGLTEILRAAQDLKALERTLKS